MARLEDFRPYWDMTIQDLVNLQKEHNFILMERGEGKREFESRRSKWSNDFDETPLELLTVEPTHRTDYIRNNNVSNRAQLTVEEIAKSYPLRRDTMIARCMAALTMVQKAKADIPDCLNLPESTIIGLVHAENALQIAVDALLGPPDFIRRV